MDVRRALPELGVEPLTARSLVLTALLGTHPPRLPVRALVALGGLFGFAEGTLRTALSRMSAAGELEATDGSYTLGERMRRRQASQDAGLLPPPDEWDGTWWVAIVAAEGRTVGERRAFRSRMRQDRMGELRPDIWLRPANIPGPAADDDLLITRGPIEARDPVELARQLWPLDDLATRAAALTAAAQEATSSLAAGNPSLLPDTFLISVAVMRFLQGEPRLPPELVGTDWPADALRRTYADLEAGHMALMESFLSRASGGRHHYTH
jgi:phenylacetic acid degradation operon negative regulatory protein